MYVIKETVWDIQVIRIISRVKMFLAFLKHRSYLTLNA